MKKSKLKKLSLIIIILIMVCQVTTIQALGEEKEEFSLQNKKEELINEQLNKLDLSEIKEQINKLNRDTGEYLPKLRLEDVIDLFTNQEVELKLKAIIQGLLRYLFKEIVINFRLLGKLIILAVIAAVLKTFQNSFAEQGISRLVNSIVYLVLVIVALNSFKVAINVGEQAIDDMVSVMQAILPLLLTLLVAVGNITSAALFQPITFLIVNLLSVLIKNITFPMLLFSAGLAVVNNISDNFNISGLAKLIREINVGLLGAFLTLFIGVLIVQGTAGAVGDGVTIRTAKYLSGAFVPVVGGIFADALDMVIGGSLLIKNALGILGVVIIFLFCSFSLLKIVALIFIYKFARAVIQPISDSRIVACLDDLSNSLIMVFAAVLSVSLMFFIMLTILIGIANMTVMLR
ncbi:MULTISPECIES: stage III sporulation protein AE [unclassified Candidatus Frackibacter]|uniref:stage III sporulation protein AE n=1 Tax=unclassified Candidatus Frackibacter TaxID=2648818 RepID=UPI000889F925|nr:MULTISPECIES: stage III sporulation protein AE [unclassified Candidatus Frackibacter]SDC03085.1 stage III sporulation protein AE [Candidatus Frackibacter sp. WG11]SEM69273.1 stage III sporulation protein AE [Candidatus Frackibacter sp. WG12]SFL80550.1 stage III sporulation protein AE [Candidatus Frackibacter sp. WG13]